MKKFELTPHALQLFLRTLPFIAAALIYLALTLSQMEPYDAARLYMRTYAMMEHIYMSLTLIVAGGLVLDLQERQRS